jgi:antitoxin (DNA-binding transcriptional repressor) of toxin-antitoxin stability system
MGYLAVKDLKKTRSLREKLEKERELILTKDGQPFALIIGISPDNVEESLNEVRRARFSTAVMRARQKAITAPASDKEINDEILKSRKNRGLK